MDLHRLETRTFFPVLDDDSADEWQTPEPEETVAAGPSEETETAGPVCLTLRLETWAMGWDSRRPRNCE